MLKGVKWLFLSMNDAAEGKTADPVRNKQQKIPLTGHKKTSPPGKAMRFCFSKQP
jgi:hypothetical protein